MKLIIILVYCIVFLSGVLVGFALINYSSITMNYELKISELGLMLATLSVGIFIPFFATKLTDTDRSVKMELRDECKEALASLQKISDKIDFCYSRRVVTKADKEEINIYFSDCELMIDNLHDSLKCAFGNNTEQIYKGIKDSFIEYWKIITGGELMNDSYTVIDENLFKENRLYWSSFSHKIKIATYAIHKL